MLEDGINLFFRYQDVYLTGVKNTLSAALAGLICAFFVGFLCGIWRFVSSGFVSQCIAVYVSFVRNTPLLVQVYFIYFGLPSLGLTINTFWTGVIALTFNSGAYICEMVRGGLNALPKGQREAACALGFRQRQLLHKILLPQAIPIILPAITGQFVQLIKDTSLLYTISVLEITKAADEIGNETYQFLPAYLVSCVLYILICASLNLTVNFYETRAGSTKYKRATS